MNEALGQISSPALRPEDWIVLLCARTRLNSAQVDALRYWGGEISDWAQVVEKAGPHRMAALILHHLRRHLGADLPDAARHSLHSLAMSEVALYLRIASTQKKLIDQVLEPSGVRHVFIKGVGLVEQYYPMSGVRPCRDIDVWIDPDEIGNIWERMKALGYRRLEKPDQTHRIPAHDAAYLLPTIDVMSPDGVLVEIHARYDHSGLTVDPDAIYQRSQLVETTLGTIRVPSLEDHFIYICQHHTRHLWSRLRWLVDLDAFARSPQFDRAAVRRRVAGTDLEPTVEACLELTDCLADPAGLLDDCGSREATELKKWILKAAVDGPATVNSLRNSNGSPDFALPWQYSWKHRVQVKLHKLKPTQADYLAFPVASRHWWIYYLMRPFRLVACFFMQSSAGRKA